MNVDKVNFRLTNGAQKTKYNRRQPNFRGNIPPSTIKGEILKTQKPLIRWMDKFSKNIGEFQDVCINAIGTGLIAPIFIRYNPLSKTDKDTRTYSAWRQPVSAVLTVTTSGLITIPFSRLIKTMSNNGSLGEQYNRTAFNDSDFIMKQMKKLNPGMTKEQLQIEVEKEVSRQEEELLRSIRNKNKINLHYAGENAPKEMSAERYKNLLLKTAKEIKANEEKQLKRFNEEKIPLRIERSEFYRTNYEASKKLLTEMKQKISGNASVEDINKFLTEKVKQLKSQKANKQLINIVNETKELAYAGKTDMLEKVNKMLGHVELHKNEKSKTEVANTVKARAKEEIARYEESIKFMDEVEKAIIEGRKVSEIETMFAQRTKAAAKTSEKGFRLKHKVFAEEVMKQLKVLTKRRIDSLSRIATLIVALAMAPVSCYLLNWVYPRFMDAVFPNLSNKKHSNVSKEMADKAAKNSEVK